MKPPMDLFKISPVSGFCFLIQRLCFTQLAVIGCALGCCLKCAANATRLTTLPGPLHSSDVNNANKDRQNPSKYLIKELKEVCMYLGTYLGR